MMRSSLIRPRLAIRMAIPLAILIFMLADVCRADPAQLTVSTTPAYSTILQGYVDAVPTKVSNIATPGSDTGNYSLLFAYPGTTVGPATGSVTAGNSTTYGYTFDSTGAIPGNNTITATLTNTSTNAVTSSSSVVRVLSHVKPAFFINGAQVPMSSSPISKATAEAATPDFGDPSAGAGVGSNVSLAAPNVMGDPPPNVVTDEMDLDSITPIGDPEISITLQPFTDLPPDDPGDSPPYHFVVDDSAPGLYYTEFEFNYSDEQDLPGADAPGSEHAYFGVLANVTGSGADAQASLSLIVPEPTSAALTLLAGSALLRRSRRKM